MHVAQPPVHSSFLKRPRSLTHVPLACHAPVFINRKKEIDIGGIHGSQSARIDLDNLQHSTLVAGQNYQMHIFHAERQTTGSNFRASTTLLGQADLICPNECNMYSGQGTCDLGTGSCLCCPGFGGLDCGTRNAEALCKSSLVSVYADDNCWNKAQATVSSDATTCGKPSTGTWADICLVPDPGSIDATLRARCDRYEGFFDPKKLTCTKKTVCGPGTFVNTTLLEPVSDRDCAPCPAGQFSEGTNAKACREHTQCDTMQPVLKEATNSTDRQCGYQMQQANMDGAQFKCDATAPRHCHPTTATDAAAQQQPAKDKKRDFIEQSTAP